VDFPSGNRNLNVTIASSLANTLTTSASAMRPTRVSFSALALAVRPASNAGIRRSAAMEAKTTMAVMLIAP
jgi:hypothetical protein